MARGRRQSYTSPAIGGLSIRSPSQWRVGSESLLRGLLMFLLIVVAVRRWVWSPELVSGDSMSPTLHAGQLGGVNRLTYQFREPRRGDIVVFWTGREHMVKRIIGLPGEEIEARDGVFYVNGQPLVERYVRLHGPAAVRAGRLGPDCFLVAGDNRSSSVVAIVRRERILGRFVCFGPRLLR